jgi:hypothetical protein
VEVAHYLVDLQNTLDPAPLAALLSELLSTWLPTTAVNVVEQHHPPTLSNQDAVLLVRKCAKRWRVVLLHHIHRSSREPGASQLLMRSVWKWKIMRALDIGCDGCLW